MKKSNLIDKLNSLYQKLEEEETTLSNCSDNITKIRREMEDLPQAPEDIEDDDKEDE